MKIRSKKFLVKTGCFSLGVAAVIGISVVMNGFNTVEASVDYSVYKANLESQLKSKGAFEVEQTDDNGVSVSRFDSEDIYMLADKVAEVQYYTANMVNTGVTSNDMLKANAVVVTDDKQQLTTTIKDANGNVLANMITVNELEMLKTNATVTIPVYDTTGKDTGATQTVSSVTLKDLYSTSNNLDGETFDGTGNIQDNLDKLDQIITSIERAGWN